ncbi:MAG: GyrI-like domain-containing protein [Bacilli bacterium]
MAFDYKKEYKQHYIPKIKPSIVDIPIMNYMIIRGKGDPNNEIGEYKKSIPLLYTVAYTLKMSYRSTYKIKNFFEYVVPPLEGFWWQEGIKGVDYSQKDKFEFISMIRLPEFITKNDLEWAKEESTKKKNQDFSKIEFFTYDEGLCVQCMHIGHYDDEPVTVKKMHDYALENGYKLDISEKRFHHEIYISDPRKSEISKLKTVVRHPIKKL